MKVNFIRYKCKYFNPTLYLRTYVKVLVMNVKEYKTTLIDVQSEPLVILNYDDANELGVHSGQRVRLVKNGRYVLADVLVSKTIVPKGTIGVNNSCLRALKISAGDTVTLKTIFSPKSLKALKKRLHGNRLSAAEIKDIIEDVVEGRYGEAEIAAFLVSQILFPLDEEELTALIKAMAESGEQVSFNEPVYDEHSIGGVPGNSKVALLAVPTVAARGVLIPKTSSRAITSPAGTADTMEVLARVDLTADEIVEIAKKVRGLLVWGGRLNIAIADDIFVEVERKLMIDPWTQMVASILSKKLAMGVSNLVIDIPVGKGAKVQDVSMAEKLAGVFITQGARIGIKTRVTITYGGQPIGRTVGPALEAKEALETLMTGKGGHSLVDKAMGIAGLVYELAGLAEPGKGFDLAYETFRKGLSYRKIREIIEAQGGDPNIRPDDIPVGEHTYTLYSPLEGAVTHIDNAAITLIAKAAGAPFDKGAGIVFHAKVGYRVRKGDPILTIHSSSSVKLEEAVRLMNRISPVAVEGMIIKVLP